MSTVPAAKRQLLSAQERPRITDVPADNLRLDWWIAIVSSVMIFGLYIDGWAHNHGRVDNSFFTPWHAILYSAYGVAALTLIVLHFRNVGGGYHWRRALPRGYMPALFGAFAFALAGLGDLLWHETFGFEESLESLLSPTHLLLATSGLLIISGPIRALWRRDTEHSWRGLFPAILAITAVASAFTFFTIFGAVSSNLRALTGVRPEDHILTDIFGVQALLMHGNILLGVVLFFSRRWRLPFGSVAFIYTINAILMIWLDVVHNADFLLVLSAAFAGLLGDLLLRPRANGAPARIRLLSCLLPFAYSLGAVLILHVLGTIVWESGGLWWAIHMWLGAPILAGVFGYGLSLLVHPPAFPNSAR